MIDNQDIPQVQQIISDYLKNQAFTHRKVTDTPTDANQVTPKKYVDSIIGAIIPSQTGNSGSVLTTNGSVVSWGQDVKVGSATTGLYGSSEYDNGSANTVNWLNGNVQYSTLTTNATYTFTNPIAGQRCILHVAGAFTPTFPSTVRWPNGVTPAATATSGKKDIYAFVYSAKEGLYDGMQSPNFATT